MIPVGDKLHATWVTLPVTSLGTGTITDIRLVVYSGDRRAVHEQAREALAGADARA